jgi:hypothetical protein
MTKMLESWLGSFPGEVGQQDRGGTPQVERDFRDQMVGVGPR